VSECALLGSSSGGKTNIVGLSKKIGNRRLRSNLIDRAGPRRAAVALANKNARTAWALVTQGTEYQRRQPLEVAA
jgi:transposase